MTRRSSISSLAAFIVVVSAVAAMAQLPTLTITTRNNQEPPHQNGSGNCANNNSTANSNKSPILKYIEMTGFKIENAGLYNSSPAITSADSIRRRGNSTSTGGGGVFGGGGNAGKIPYRVKFDKRINFFGMGESKSWALIANWYDPSQMLNAIAFTLGKRMGLDNSRPYQFVRLNFNGKDLGVYMLTPQISGNKYGGVNVDIENGGWMVEFDYHGASDAEDCKRFFNAAQYNMNTKIRSPEGDELNDVPGKSYDHVKSDVNGLMNAVSSGTGYRDMIDIQDWAKYVLIQLFMDNFDFNNKAMASGNTIMPGQGSGVAEPGSNYAYRVNSTGKIKAGPLWDFDLAAGVAAGGSFTFEHFANYTDMTRPTHPFYKKLFEDNANGGFLPCYVSAWDTHKSMIQSVSATGGLIDSLMNLIAPSIAGNNAQNLSNATRQSYEQYVGRLKTWWNNRYTYFNQQMPTASGTCPGSDTPNPGTFSLTVNRNPTAGGNVKVNNGSNNPSPSTHNANASITVEATAASGYTFTGWSGAPSSVTNTSSSTITFNITSNTTLTANFLKDGDDPPGGGNVRIEAEAYTSKTPNNSNDLRIVDEPGASGDQVIGYITNGNTATYNNVNVTSAGTYKMEFRLASEQTVNFSVSVNGQSAGTVSVSGGTGGWSSFTTVALPGNGVNFNAGDNTVVLTFQGAVNLDYFEIVGATTPVYGNHVARSRAAAQLISVRGRTLSVASPVNAEMRVRVIDVKGKVRANFTAHGSGSFSLVKMPAGRYFVEVIGAGVKQTSPIILK